MNTLNTAVSTEATTATATAQPIATFTYHFKRMPCTDENLAKLAKGYVLADATPNREAIIMQRDCSYDIEYTLQDGSVVLELEEGQESLVVNAKIKRHSESYNLDIPSQAQLGLVLPTVVEGDEGSKAAYEFALKQAAYIQSIVDKAIETYGRPLIDQGIELSNANCSWVLAVEAAAKAAASVGSSSKSTGISKELLAASVESFKEYLEAIGKNPAGIDAMCKMFRGRFSANTVAKYINGLEAVKANILNWIADGCTTDEQDIYSVVALDMVGRIDAALAPKEDVGDLF